MLLSNPPLLGILVDVSGSMMTSMGGVGNRLQVFREVLRDNIRRADGALQGRITAAAESTDVFGYGFGFDGPGSFLSRGPKVRDLFSEGHQPATVALSDLARDWPKWEGRFMSQLPAMFGSTPMVEGLRAVRERLFHERLDQSIARPAIVFLLSDGEPTDGSPAQVIEAARAVRQAGATIVSCYVTDESNLGGKRLYSKANESWPVGARVMLECASEAGDMSGSAEYLRARGWTFEPGCRLFAQINSPDVLGEFMGAAVGQVDTLGETNVFVSYAHEDEEYVSEQGLVGYLKILEKDGFRFWHDRDIPASADWNEQIEQAMARTSIVLAIVSQRFLLSRYCQDVEMERFVRLRESRGLTILPVVVSPCDWKSYPWLANTQFEPRDGKTIEEHFRDRGSRDRLYLSILDQLRAIRRASLARA